MSEDTQEQEVVESDLEKAVRVVSSGRKHEMDDDTIKVMLVQAGFKFRKAGNMFDAACQELGIQLSSKSRYEKVSALFEKDVPELLEWSDVQAVSDYLASTIELTSEKEAFASLKRYCKEHEIALPEKPKAERSERGSSGLTAKVTTWILENPNATGAELVEYCDKVLEGSKGFQGLWVRIFKICKQYHEALSS